MEARKKNWITAMLALAMAIACSDKTSPPAPQFPLDLVTGTYDARIVIYNEPEQFANLTVTESHVTARQLLMTFDPKIIPDLVGNIQSTYLAPPLTHCQNCPLGGLTFGGLTFTISALDTLKNYNTGKIDEYYLQIGGMGAGRRDYYSIFGLVVQNPKVNSSSGLISINGAKYF